VHFNETEFPYHEQLISFPISPISMSSPSNPHPSLTIIYSNTDIVMHVHSSSIVLLIDNNIVMPNSTDSIVFEIQLVNSHPMVTRAKVGTFKPKTYTTMGSIPIAATSVKEAITSTMWFQYL